MDVLSPKLPLWMRFDPLDDKVIDFFLRPKKTNWVLHEHYKTLKELDATHPVQNAFVPCPLSYKHEKKEY
ncbi:hypothetical protein CIPAW_05G206900 [Carya illinoinensis]|uniref:Uncharacterized protein n=1 Tax=Carya illinoinensis TaxID=32201 RepID=A0A8T1QKN9_CARIL|nr:hypothetical protein CIPAW_05G206900 [Carya illinoinensis]